MTSPEIVRRKGIGEVQLIQPFVLGLELSKRRLLDHRLFGSSSVRVDLLWRKQELPQLFAIDGFEIVDGDFVVAGGAAVFRRVRPDVHLLATGAVRETSEEMH